MSFHKKFHEYYVEFLIFFASKKRGMLRKLRKNLVLLKNGLEQEGVETKEMFRTYSRYTQGKATAKQMAEANKQFAEIIKGLGVGVLLVLPFAPLSIPFIVALGKRLGVDIIPSSFNSSRDNGENKDI